MSFRTTGLALAALCAAAMLPSSAQAHPHVWVTSKTEVEHDAKGRITAFRHQWTFDEVFSAFAAQGMDANGDGKFDRAELAELAKVNITSLAEFDFFTFAEAAGEKVALKAPPEGYYLSHEDGRLTLHFELPLETPLDARAGEVKFAIYDPTYYVDFAYADESPVRLTGGAPEGCALDMREPPPLAQQEQNLGDLSEAFYNALGPGSDYGAQFARDVFIVCKAG